MKINNAKEINDFIDVLNQTTGDVWLQSIYGDRISLKSELSRYIAIAQLIEEKSGVLELFCSNSGDESLFYEYFRKHPDSLE